ncbi:LAME_0F15478g1_1 [Lachancea meyersii CBS 8951]|uniref:LAME_0F15478g1_1 n=1 Tax=Lachancea meyersii CBS 8951 TaxID=1266667 RepID=A0A1G4JYG6_9SACH|nr:LAME_0F15478g1_1 [Lachancea meyersii CBS 8951]
MDTILQTAVLLGFDRALPTELCGEIDATCLINARLILGGRHEEVIQELLKATGLIGNCSFKDPQDLHTRLKNQLSSSLQGRPNLALLLAIALLQSFIQSNFTGPAAAQSGSDVLACIDEQKDNLHRFSISLLSVLGQSAYGLCDDAIYLVMSLILLEQISQQPSLFGADFQETAVVEISPSETPAIVACAHWWRARAIMVQMSLLPEPTGPHPIVASSVFNSIDLVYAITKEIPPHLKAGLEKELGLSFYLENVKCSLAANTEHLCLPSLTKAQKLTEFQFVLTGARAKRTKYQNEFRSGLIIMAQSLQTASDLSDELPNGAPESLALESDHLLERPIFESIGNEPLDEQIVKRPKKDQEYGLDEERLLPIAVRQEDIPVVLRELDPNDQPPLSDDDNVQLLLRMQVIRQTSPAQNSMVEQELGAIVNRVLYQSGQKNWTVFSRALWERSLVETTKAKTIERGLLQMQSLVEELGLKIKSRMLPQDSSDDQTNNIERLKYVHKLPFVPRWAMDAKLAEKYMSLGVLKSAVEIYERLSMVCEAALCHAAVGDEKTAEKILIERIEENPNDARALSILGDIRQDPNLWLKSWEIGKHVNAKNSLARYYYNPPTSSGLKKDTAACLKHLNESLRLYPLAFDTWYFYGCVALECGQMDIAAEAFTRCVSLDATHSISWSNLSAAFMEQGKLKEAHSCLSKAISSDSPNNWRIWDNYMLVSMKLNLWPDVLMACRKLVEVRKDKMGEFSIDMPVVEKLVELLVTSDFPVDESQRLTHFQSSCMEFICDTLPSVVTTNSKCWKQVAKVEMWRKKPWASLECYEKEYRAMSHNPDLEFDERVWNDTVEACDDLIAAYESLGEMEGKHGPGSLVCKDWKYKARSTIKSLMSRGRNNWQDSEGWEKLVELRNNL